MTQLRPECKDAAPGSKSLPRDTALYMIRDSVLKRRTLIHGHLHDGHGHHCAIGCFWADHPTYSLPSDLIDEVAAVNDSVPRSATPQERWKKVSSWLRWKLRVMATEKATR